MSRHNRRRVRGNHRADQINFSKNDGLSLLSLSPEPSQEPRLPAIRRPCRNDLTIRHWHNRYIAWQGRDRKQREEQERLRAEQRRVFGGDSQDGDDADGLCVKMMEYFVGLEYLEES